MHDMHDISAELKTTHFQAALKHHAYHAHHVVANPSKAHPQSAQDNER
jgi:hypothetical protein